ncbi:uncharacterized [Lates japonicus]
MDYVLGLSGFVFSAFCCTEWGVVGHEEAAAVQVEGYSERPKDTKEASAGVAVLVRESWELHCTSKRGLEVLQVISTGY